MGLFQEEGSAMGREKQEKQRVKMLAEKHTGKGRSIHL